MNQLIFDIVKGPAALLKYQRSPLSSVSLWRKYTIASTTADKSLGSSSSSNTIRSKQTTSSAPKETEPNLVELFVNGMSVKIESGSAIIQACSLAGIEIPRFCYHERLSVAGNCRMCLVEIEKNPKPVASCAMPVMPGMKVLTDSPMVKKAREGVMEFLLANHPLDCPICDQGGECDLQDQSMGFGSDRGRFNEDKGKRAVEDKNFGPLVKTVMTRCIHCTRCVRFAVEVAGMDELGTTGRGNEMQIGTYVEKTLSSELSGNIIDLCPVGALTSKPYAFTARPWELKNTESIDILDAVGSAIRIDSRGQTVMRILPRLNEDVNEEWLSDKGRFAYDALTRQRLTYPMLKTTYTDRSTSKSTWTEISWEKTFGILLQQLRGISGPEIRAYSGALADVEAMSALKDLLFRLGSEECYLDGSYNSALLKGLSSWRPNYLCNTSMTRLEEADAILLIGTNPRHEAPLFNARIRKAYLQNGCKIGIIGELPKLNYAFDHLGDTPESLVNFMNGKNATTEGRFGIDDMKKAKRPVIIVGSSILERKDAIGVFLLLNELCASLSSNLYQSDWNGYNVLHREASRPGALDIGFLPQLRSQLDLNSNDGHSNSKTKPKFIYLLQADDVNSSMIPDDAFVVYQGTHGDKGAEMADLILPGAAYTEKDATYVNIEGRSQMTKSAVPCPTGAREDWKIIRALSEVVGHPLPYDNQIELRNRLMIQAPHLICTGALYESFRRSDEDKFSSSLSPGLRMDWVGDEKEQSKWRSQIDMQSPFSLPIKDYYLTDPISRNSTTMAKCSQVFTNGRLSHMKEPPFKIS